MYIRSNTKHRHIPVECIYKRFNYITSPFFRHAGILCKHLYRLQYCNTLVYFRLVMCHVKSIADTLFIGIKKNLSFLFQIGNVLIKQRTELKTVHHDFKTIIFYYVSESFLGIVKSKSVLVLIVKLCSAERAFYDKTCTCIGFPLASAFFTLHQTSPSFGEFHNSMKIL